MALIECPECGKQISNKSITCINCGYPLQTAQPSQFEIINQDNSSVRGFIAYFKDRNEKNKGYYYIFGNNEENAISIFLKKNPELSVADKHEIRELFESGKFSCPSCKARFTNCEKKNRLCWNDYDFHQSGNRINNDTLPSISLLLSSVWS